MFLTYLSVLIRRFIKDEEAASAIEYAIVASMVALIAILFLTNIGVRIRAMFNAILTGLGGTAV
ncbi:Flp family type IVb pilin [Pseudomonas sp. LP_7_YM]|uniref:Flp family type IVb pilin n=1 Tax=Pseudomonas sp. LP_7_YM TaxID=2485137 RepID=UPI001061F4E1|nr:Flp family type IVb pilin [Pseudomonas sp. LP_7_YM]TDV65842.1 pilus assembly protein Flp/PilA [Pseudomonas sp. LP_7_YM]